MTEEKLERRRPGRPRRYGSGRINATVRFTPERYADLKTSALQSGRSISEEVEVRVERALQYDQTVAAMAIMDDMKITWARFAERFLLLDLEEKLAQALARATDPEVAKLATAWLTIRKDGRAS